MLKDPSARDTYEAFAPIYDEFNHRNNYELWFSELLPRLEERGLRKGRLLDVGCGTGRAFEPMLRRGWEIVGCDLSPGMLAEARAKFGAAVPLFEADVRDLPRLGQFELVWALNDVVNYLLEDGELVSAFESMLLNLAPDGRVVFDANTLKLFADGFASGESEDMDVGRWRWVGQSREVVAGAIYEARILGEDQPIVNRERHYPGEAVEAAAATAGLKLVGALGQREEGSRLVLEEPPDEQRDHKILYVLARG